MRITHLLFDEYPYITSWGYQENRMAEAQVENGDEVSIIAGRYIPRVLEGFLTLDQLEQTNYVDDKGIVVIRLEIGNPKFSRINRKIKSYKNLYRSLVDTNPELLFVHDLHAFGMFSVRAYMKKHPKTCCCLADVHVTFVNSGTNMLSKLLLHGLFYRAIIKCTVRVITKIYYLDENCKDFIAREYGLKDESKLELLPLGGVIFSEKKQNEIRANFLRSKGLSHDTMIFVHSGKLNKNKRTIELLKAFQKNPDKDFLLIIIGRVAEEIKDDFHSLLERDARISFLGWKTADELNQYLAMADVYLQPGTPSVTAHEAMCKGCATLLNGKEGFYRKFIPEEAAIYVNQEEDLVDFFMIKCEDRAFIQEYQKKGYEMAKDIFDYRKQTEKIKEEALKNLARKGH